MTKNKPIITVTRVYNGKQKPAELLTDIVLTMLLEDNGIDGVLP